MSRGRRGGGRAGGPAHIPRHGNPRSGRSGTPALPFPGRGFALRPPAAPRSGNFCGKGSRRQGHRCGPGRAHPGHLPPHDPGPPGAAGVEGEAALTCCRRSARAPSLPELHLPLAGGGGAPSRLRRPPAAAFRHRGPPTRPAAGPACRNAKPTSRLRRLLPMKSLTGRRGPPSPRLPAAAPRAAPPRPAPAPAAAAPARPRPAGVALGSASAPARPSPWRRRRKDGGGRPGPSDPAGWGERLLSRETEEEEGKSEGPPPARPVPGASSHLALPSAKRLC